jgi:hypothetical protein
MSAPIKPEGAGAPAPAPQAPLPSTDEWSEGFYSTPTGEAADTTTATPAPTNAPTQGFFDRLLHGVDGKSRLKEVARSIPRGLASLGNAAVQTGAEIGAAALDAANVGGTEAEQDDRRKRAKGARAVSEEEMSLAYGARSDDPLASLTETVVQGASAMLLFQGAGLGTIAAGAATDAIAFDPYSGGLSELANQYGDRIPGIGGIVKAAGELGTVDEQSNYLTSRIKRAVEGGIVGMALEGVVWSAKKVLAVKRGDAAAVKEADKVLTDIVDGTHTPQDAEAVVARPTEDGQWELKESPTLKQPVTGNGRVDPAAHSLIDNFRSHLTDGDVRLTPEGNPGVRVVLHPKGGKVVELRSIENLTGQAKSGMATAEMQRLIKEADRAGVTLTLQASPFGDLAMSREKLRDFYRKFGFEQTKHGDANMVRQPGELDTGFRESGPRVATEAQPEAAAGPKFTDRAEAEAQATTINVHMAEKAAAAKPALFSPEQVAKHEEIADRLFHSQDPAEVERLMNGTDFNFEYLGGSDRVHAQIEALSEQFRKSFDRARKTGGVSNDATVKMAEGLAKQYGMADFAQAFHGTADDVRNLSVRLLLGNRAVEQLGERLAGMAALRRQRPHDPVLLQEARELLGTWQPLARDVAGVNSEVGRSLQVLQARSRSDVKAIKIGDVATEEAKGAKPKATPSANAYDKMTDAEIDAALRMYERAGGAPRNAQAVIDGLKVLSDKPKGRVGSVIEMATNVFINSLISGTRTFQTIFASGNTMLHFEYLNRMIAGAASGNPTLAREGADMLYAHYAYAADNVRVAAASFREQRSIIDPSPSLYATGGVVNTVVSLPGRLAGSIDEFTRVTGYRAFERAKALRQARAQGLNGAALVKQVEADVKASIDPQHGVGLNPEALRFAGVPTLSDPLGAGTFSGDLSNMLAKYPVTKFIVPFIRPGVNTFRYVGKSTPGINLFYKDVRETLARGGEDAAVLMTRTALAGSMYAYAWSKMADGTITGRGPSDMRLRNEWLKNHQPYSVKIGGVWKSYRRMDPFGTFIGMAADAHMVQLEVADDEGTSGEDIGKAVFASVLANAVNKSYMQGLSTFLTAVDDQDLSSANKFLGTVAGGYVPQAVQQFNDDPYYREAQTLVDEAYKRTPGLSDRLPPKYNFLGEPVMKQGTLWNRNFSIAREASANPSLVEDTLVRDGIRLSPPPDKEFNGAIDFKDDRWMKDGKLPYVRWMELMSGGWGERKGLRAKLEEIVKSDSYQHATGGTATYPGGERGIIVASVKDAWEEAAKHQMLREYPELQRAWKGAKGLKGSALQNGQAGVDARRQQFGVPVP